MIIEQDKANLKLFIASGEIMGFSVIAEGSSEADAVRQWVFCARERMVREWGYDNTAALGVVH